MLKATAFLLSFLYCAAAFAQGVPYVKEREMVMLLAQRTVSEDLQLTSELKERVNEKVSEAKSLTSRGSANEQQYKAILAEVHKLLSKEQQTRLYQTWLQLAHASVLFDEKEVKEALKLDASTKSKIVAAAAKQQQAIAAMAPELQSLFESGDTDEMKSKLLRFKHKSDQDILNLLSAEQRETLAKLKGKLIEIDPFLGQLDNF